MMQHGSVFGATVIVPQEKFGRVRTGKEKGIPPFRGLWGMKDRN
jgi:hypothetical protein